MSDELRFLAKNRRDGSTEVWSLYRALQHTKLFDMYGTSRKALTDGRVVTTPMFCLIPIRAEEGVTHA